MWYASPPPRFPSQRASVRRPVARLDSPPSALGAARAGSSLPARASGPPGLRASGPPGLRASGPPEGAVGEGFLWRILDVRTLTFCQLMIGFSIPLKVKLLAGEQKATEFLR